MLYYARVYFQVVVFKILQISDYKIVSKPYYLEPMNLHKTK